VTAPLPVSSFDCRKNVSRRGEKQAHDFMVQSPGQDVRTGLTPPGVSGQACHGGSNPENP
jgi:hypothetical protein